MNETNGSAKPKQLEIEDLKKWGLCYVTHDGGLLGPVESTEGTNEHTPDVVVLGNAFVFASGHRFAFGSPQPGTPGQPLLLAGIFQIAPFEFLSTQVRLAVRPVMFLALAVLPDADFQDLGAKILSGVQQAEQMRMQSRAQKSGIALAGSGTKLPPMRLG